MKRILVTGANKGIGLAIARGILREEADTHVLLGSRDTDRGEQARQTLANESTAWRERIDVVTIDVADDDSVRAAAERTAAPLFAIVNNAGIGLGVADLARVVQVNTFGIQRVCTAFLPLIDPHSGRIVNVTSAAGPNFVARCSSEMKRFFLDGNKDWDTLRAFIEDCLSVQDAATFLTRGLDNGDPYGFSKACANTWTQILARENPQLLINACTPGFIATDLTLPRAAASGTTPQDMGMKSPDEGARCPLFLLFGEVPGSGWYFGSDGVRSPLDRYRAPGSPPYDGK